MVTIIIGHFPIIEKENKFIFSGTNPIHPTKLSYMSTGENTTAFMNLQSMS